MLRLLWTLSVHTRRGLKWGISAMLLAIPSLFAAAVFRYLIEGGRPGWLHLLVLMCI